MKFVIVTGGFDPIHSGHIAYISAARKLGDRLIVGVNSDEWLIRKKGRAFMPLHERRQIVGSLRDVDATMTFNDSDGSAVSLLEEIKTSYPYAQIIFANGGDRTAHNIPEMVVKGIEFRFGVGGDNKVNSSSWILEEWKSPKTDRTWGHYRVLYDMPGTKVKELTVKPGQSLSMQRHSNRNEFWFVAHGRATVKSDEEKTNILKAHEHTFIPKEHWHQLHNNTESDLKLVEIQYGTQCTEEDIQRV